MSNDTPDHIGKRLVLDVGGMDATGQMVKIKVAFTDAERDEVIAALIQTCPDRVIAMFARHGFPIRLQVGP